MTLKKSMHDRWHWWGGGAGLFLIIWPWIQLSDTLAFATAREMAGPLFASAIFFLYAVRPSLFNQSCSDISKAPDSFQVGVKLMAWGALFGMASAMTASSQLLVSTGLVHTGAVLAMTVGWVWVLRRKQENTEHIFRALFLGAGAVCLFMLVMWQNNDMVMSMADRLTWTFAMSPSLGGYAMMAVVIGGWLLHDGIRSGAEKKWLALVLVMLLLIAIAQLLTLTRSCLVGLMAGIWIFVMLTCAATWRKRVLWGGLIVVLVACGGVGWYLSTPEGRLHMMESSWGTRVGYFQTALMAWIEKPIFGWGVGQFPFAFGWHSSPLVYLHPQNGGYTDVAHCLPMHILVEGGLVGLGIWIAVIFCGYRGAYRAWQQRHPAKCLGVGGMLMVVQTALMTDALFNPAYKHWELLFLEALVLGAMLTLDSMHATAQISSEDLNADAIKDSKQALAKKQVAASAMHMAWGWRVLTLIASGMLLVPVWGTLGASRALLQSAMVTSLQDEERQLLHAREITFDTNDWIRAESRLASRDYDARILERSLFFDHELLQVIPTFLPAWHRTIATWELKNQPVQKLVALCNALRRLPQQSGLREQLHALMSHMSVDMVGEVQKTCSTLELAWMNDGDWVFLKALAMYYAGEKGEALQMLTMGSADAVQIVPLASEVARLLVAQGMLTQARPLLEELCLSIPADPTALTALAQIEVLQQQPQAALPFLERALMREKGDVNASLLLAQTCLALAQKFPENGTSYQARAVNVMNDMVEAHRGSVTLWMKLIRVYAMIGDRAQAQSNWIQADKIFPHNAELIDIKDELFSSETP